MESELLDWEVLHNSESDSNSVLLNSPELRNLEAIEVDAEGMIRSDYFSLDNQSMYAKEGDVSEEGSIESDNPSWIDPKLENQCGRNISGDFWSDSGSDRSDDRKSGDFDVRNELGFAENEKVFEGIVEMEASTDKPGAFKPNDTKFSELHRKKELGFGGFGEIQDQNKDSGKFCSVSCGDGLVSMKFEDVEKGGDIGFSDCMEKVAELVNSDESDDGNGSNVELEGGKGNPIVNEDSTIDEIKLCLKSLYEGDKKKIVWWKVPFELLRYCVFKVSPVWSFSVAVAVMGFVVLGHRFYKMKRKSRNLHLKVTLDDKKVSQFMTRTARLNEAFSVVRRVPITRPSLPTTGVNSWPMMSLR
ncbi:hypothetical protein DITRI_Ditri03aG0127300 [Diplodiscus trichospermus]